MKREVFLILILDQECRIWQFGEKLRTKLFLLVLKLKSMKVLDQKVLLNSRNTYKSLNLMESVLKQVKG